MKKCFQLVLSIATYRTIKGVKTLFLWDGWDLIEERDITGAQVRRYVHGAAVDEILVMVDGQGAKHHVHDALGSVTGLVDENGAVVESYLYDLFGQVAVFDGSGVLQTGTGGTASGNRFLYTGREWVAEAGLYDYRNRVYSPKLGRFMQVDPIRFWAGDVNLYRYVGNKTPLLIDPSGLQPKDKHFGLPNDFWKWNHRQEGKDDLEDIDRETAEERCEEWEAAGRPNAEGTRTTPEKGDGESNKERPTTPPMPPSMPYNPPYTPPEPPTAPPISPGAAVGIGTVIGLGLLTAAAVISPFDGPALDFAAGSAFVGALATY